jgi:UDP-glucuronate 4-epimerase
MNRNDRPVVLTGVAGFVGYHVAERLLEAGLEVVGVDAVDSYYDPALKWARLALLQGRPRFRFERLDLADAPAVERLFAEVRPERVIHLAAQAGVRYSVSHPHAYVHSNLAAFTVVLDVCHRSGVGHLVYASSSSVYGFQTKMPFSERDAACRPASLYAATKRANELLAHSYSHVHGLPSTGLRLFTVYGPWGRPDMALTRFAKSILAGEPVEVYNGGDLVRDFTYVDDVVAAIVRAVEVVPSARTSFDAPAHDPATSSGPFRILNVGSHRPVPVGRVLDLLEGALGVPAVRAYLPAQPGDVPATFADLSELRAVLGELPITPIEVGIERFASWYRAYYR